MFRNYLKVATRYLFRHKGYAMINILGLSVGVAACLLIMLFVKSEWSYDRFNSKSDRLYRVWIQENYGPDKIFTDIATPIPLGPTLKANMPDVEEFSRVDLFTTNVKAAGQSSSQENINMVDSAFFKMFDFKLIEGNPNVPFPNVNSIIITKESAKKYFGNTNPVGQNLEVQMGQENVNFTVSGVVDHVPQESSIRFDMLISFDNASHLFTPRQMNAWTQIFTETYVLLKRPFTQEEFAPKFEALIKLASGDKYKPGVFSLHLQPITDIHLDTSIPAGNWPTSSPVYSYVLGVIGILILLIACINYITLSIGRSTTRAMEVGVRKVMGADRRQLVQQFWMEAILFTGTSVIIGLLLAIAFLKPFNELFQRNLSLAIDPVLILIFVGLLLFIALVAGIYPSIVLSAFNPAEVFQHKSKSGTNIGLFRRSLIVTQFIASISMIICTLVISEQLNYIKNKDLGYNKDQVVIVPTNKRGAEGQNLATRYIQELSKIPQVKSSAASLYSFSEPQWIQFGFTDDDGQYRKIQVNEVDQDFIPTMNIQLLEGRNFQSGNSADLYDNVIVNQAFLDEFKIDDPIGKKLPGKFRQHIIGVVKDFNFESLYTKIQPLVLVINADSMGQQTEDVNINFPPQPHVSVRLDGGNLAANIQLLKNAWEKIAPNQEFEYHFLDESIAEQYADEQRISKMIQLASLLSIFIACMGLFGLATLVVNRRTKEIGIRKILGANYASIISLITKDFVYTVVISSLIAFPLAWWAMSRWLQDFAYRIDISWWVFLLSMFIALIITVATVGLNAMKVALASPVKSLRTE